MNIFEELKDGSFALFIKSDTANYYHADISWYLISHWYSEILNGKYFELIDEYRINYDLFENAIKSVKSNIEEQKWGERLNWNLPVLIINFDTNHLINNYPEQCIEDYVPKNWKGEYVAKRKEFLQLIPDELNYWSSINI